MSTRRNFLKQTSLATTGLMLSRKDWFKSRELIGLQLYTLRNEISKDLEGTIAKVAEIGYTSVEAFGYGNGKFFGKTPEEFAAIIKKNHLVSPSGHYMMISYLTKGDEEDLKKTVADAAIMGHEFIVVPFLFDNMRTSLDDYKKLAEKINKAAAEAKKSGLKLAYHNHNFEFKDWGEGKTGFEIFIKETDPSLVSFEMDIYWVTRAGLDPIQLIKENPGRIKMWHVKDMSGKEDPSYTTNGSQYFTEVGSGIINYKEIFKHKKESGMKYFFVEQDEVKLPVYESITKSLGYIKKNLLG
ncbi:MAG: sugar phosphate isomerase/epimerase [Bacteroidetes bacterium]|nr:sugar phosphate isomerase/epimerase [Bacteroidota bacterium]MBS1974268.1 sugar phosphate isomerase/epimerase [Bacteroidota bacterium]